MEHMNLTEQHHPAEKENHQELLSVKTYLRVFAVILILAFVNIGFSRLTFVNPIVSVLFILFIAVIQTSFMLLFFMELIHESRFFSLILCTTVLFILSFIAITLFEVRNRGVFSYLEDAKFMRQVDELGNYAPNMPKRTLPPEPTPVTPAHAPAPVH